MICPHCEQHIDTTSPELALLNHISKHLEKNLKKLSAWKSWDPGPYKSQRLAEVQKVIAKWKAWQEFVKKSIEREKTNDTN